MKILITGGAGSIAQAIKIKLEDWEYTVLTPNHKELDVTNISNITTYIAKNKPNVIINCAGYILPNLITVEDYESFIKHFQINVFGAYYCSKIGISYGANTIINIGSTSAFEGRPSWGAYCASKAALMSFTETLAKEGIYAYGLHPARTDTKMREELFPKEDKTTLMRPERVAEFALKILQHEFQSGSHIIVKKDSYLVLPSRICP